MRRTATERRTKQFSQVVPDHQEGMWTAGTARRELGSHARK